MSKKISALTALTTPADGDLLPIVDVSDTTDGVTGTTKKIALSNFFPASSTDNAIARFDSTTGKLLQNSDLNLLDNDVNNNVILTPNTASNLLVSAKSGAGVGKAGFIMGGSSSDNVGGAAYTLAGNGNGANAGGTGYVQGGQGGATGAGGAAIVQGGAGGATSGDGGTVSIIGGSATNGDSSGGAVILAPGSKTGSGTNGAITMFPYRGADYGIALNLDSIASSNKTYTFQNVTGIIPTVTSGAGVPTGTAPVALGQIYVDTANSKVYVSKGTSAGSDWLILN